LSGQGAGHVIVVADTSGSITEREHRVILGALCGMMAAVRPKRVTVVFCDTVIQRVDTFDGEPDPDTCATLVVPKGGGTSFIPAIEWAVDVARGETDDWGAADMPPPEALIYVTDLYGPAPPKAPVEFPVLWVSVSDAPHPWGERVTIDPDSLV
jgi:predicted metal-dependent peptidase